MRIYVLYLCRYFYIVEGKKSDLYMMSKKFPTIAGYCVVVATGLLMLFGVGWPADNAIGTYLKPRVGDAPSYWYITFHIKLVSAVLLIFWDFWMGAQIFRLARGVEPKRWWPLAVLMALTGALLVHVTIWLSLASLGVGYNARFFGYAGIFLMIGAGVFGARKLARSDSRGKYMALHGFTAALVILIVILVIARPFSHGGPTL